MSSEINDLERLVAPRFREINAEEFDALMQSAPESRNSDAEEKALIT